jgi:hypothetical protein
MTKHTTHHAHEDQEVVVDKPISFNLGIVKGKMTFKQFIIVLSVISVLSLIVFSSIKINSSIISYNKEPVEMKKGEMNILRKDK